MSEPNPQLFWNAMNGHQQSAALRAAVELEVCTHIGAGAATPEAIASASGASPKGIRVLCDFLSVNGFLTKSGEEYSLTPTSAVFLDKHSPGYMGSAVQFVLSPKAMSAFTGLTEAVRRGGTALPQGGMTESNLAEWEIFAESMTPMMRAPSEFIAERAAELSPGSVLDVAAGHGLFGIAVARKAPGASITALDWPGVLRVASRNAEKAGVSDRYSLLPGDAFAVDLGGGYDVILLTNFLHHFPIRDCESMLVRLRHALKPGGTMFTLEFAPDSDRLNPPIPATFALMMLAMTPEGDSYTKDELREMLKTAGFLENQVVDVPMSPQQLLISR